MHVETTLCAVQRPRPELQAKHLGVGDKRIGAPVPDLDRLVDECVRLRRLLSDGVDGAFEDVSLSRPDTRSLGLLETRAGWDLALSQPPIGRTPTPIGFQRLRN